MDKKYRTCFIRIIAVKAGNNRELKLSGKKNRENTRQKVTSNVIRSPCWLVEVIQNKYNENSCCANMKFSYFVKKIIFSIHIF